jgi:hypothetical protein
MTNTQIAPNELGERFQVGDEVFSHYTMRAGIVGEVDSMGWFELRYAEGGSDYLDGTRVCSLAHARRMGWLS